jgi:hypothetical protein
MGYGRRPAGTVGAVLELRDGAAKNGAGHRIPLHPQLRQALVKPPGFHDVRVWAMRIILFCMAPFSALKLF